MPETTNKPGAWQVKNFDKMVEDTGEGPPPLATPYSRQIFPNPGFIRRILRADRRFQPAGER